MATVSKLSNAGIMYTSGEIDEVTNNLAAQGSILFNGTTQYLSVASNSALAFGTGSFTIECWVYISAYSSNAGQIIDFRPAGTPSTAGYALLTMGPSGILYYNTGGGNQITGPTLSLNTWYHIALVKNVTTTTLYVNGASVGSFSDSSTYLVGASRPTIGTDGNSPASAGYSFNGYISNLRVVVGVGVYTGPFTPPTQPLQKTQSAGTNIAAITNGYTSLLLSTLYNNAFKDLSNNNFTITSTANPTSTPQHPFNFDGYYSNRFFTNKTLTPTGTLPAIGTADFTIEFWIQFTTIGNQNIYDSRASGVGGQISPTIYIQASNTFRYYVAADLITSTTVITTGTWYHVAISRVSSSTRMFINGVQEGSTISDTRDYISTANRPAIGFDGSTGTTGFMNAYLSNVRQINGTGLYTTTFIPSTTPLTAVLGTSLLTAQSKTTKDNSINNFAMAGNRPAVVSNPIPFYSISYASTGLPISKQYSNGALQTVGSFDEISLNPTLNGSISFDGANEYISIPASSRFAFGTGDFTIEAWVYFDSTSIAQIIDGSPNGGGSAPLSPIINTNGGVFNLYSSGAYRISGTTTIIVSRWYHVAVVRISGSTKLYVNGVQEGVTYADTTTYSSSGSLFICRNASASNSFLDGFISTVRIVKGLGIYTGTFTPPSQRLQLLQDSNANIAAITNTSVVSLLLNTYKTAYEDSSIYNNVINVQLALTTSTKLKSTEQSPFQNSNGYNSFSFNGSDQCLSLPASSLIVATGNFTIEAWFYVKSFSLSANPVIASQYDVNPGNWIFGQISATNIYCTPNTNNLPSTIDYSTTVNVRQWYHLAMVRNGSTVSLYLNGTSVGTSTYTGSFGSIYPTTDIGSQGGSFKWNGFISNLRMVNGDAVYTSNFTPSTVPLTVTTNTKYLTCQSGSIIDVSNTFDISQAGSNPSLSPVLSVPNTPFTLSTALPANTTMRKQYNNGTIQIINKFDEYTSIA